MDKSPIPFGRHELVDYMQNFDEKTQDDLDKYIKFRLAIIRDENKEKKLSKPQKKKTEEELEKVKASLGYKQISENTVKFEKIWIVEYNFGFYKFEKTDSLGTIEIKDANNDPGYLFEGRLILKSIPDAIEKGLR